MFHVHLLQDCSISELLEQPFPCIYLSFQEAALCRQLPMDSENMLPVQTAVNTPAMTQDMRPITNNGSDPFLSRQVHSSS